ncbi:MAG: GHKL domain-containing protein [Bacteroidales bacterium]|nr:GHKL domain-containing protein [Bacteroidales bacterium]MCF8454287.1 GHKL domain-containing protein [Bacteroidales bacterium]
MIRIHAENRTLQLTLRIILFCLFAPVFLIAQNQEIGLPYLKNYSPSEYKAHVQNFDVVQDSRGVMYFANFRGVLEFDGQTWRIIQTSKISQVISLAIDAEGTIYVGGAGEIGFLQPDSKGDLLFRGLTELLSEEDRHFQNIINIQASKDRVYFITDSSILLWNGTSFKTIKSEGPINAAYYVNGKLYFYDKGNGLQYLHNDEKVKIPILNFLSEAIVINGMMAWGTNKVLIATGSNGLLLLDDLVLSGFTTSDDNYLRKNNISCAIRLKDGTIALGTERAGIVVFDADGMLKQKIDQGIQNDYVRAIYSDRNDVLWLALDNGISRVEIPSYLSFFDEKQGIEGAVNQILRFNKKLYFATIKGLFTYDDDLKKYKAVYGINSTCWSILPDNNSILAATSRGIFRVNDNSVSEIIPGFSLKLFRSKIDDSNIYVGQIDGITHLKKKDGLWISTGKIPDIEDEISEIEEDENGILWAVVATRGLVRIDPDGISQPVFYDDHKGLPSRFGNHLSLVENKLFVTTQNGMFGYDAKADTFSLINIFRNDTLMPKEWISTIVEDSQGNLWTNSGDETHIQMRTRNDSDALAQILLKPIQDKTIWAIYPEKDGKVWFGGTEGAFSFDSKIKKDLSKVPTAIIRNVTVNGDSTLFAGTFMNENGQIANLQPDSLISPMDWKLNTLTFKYASPSFNMYEAIEYQYYLDGLEADSSSWTTEIQKEYTKLPPGEYRFLVRAKNIYGQITQPATYAFSIKNPWYSNIVAYIIYFLLFGFLVYLIVRIRSQQLIQDKKNLENLIKERTAEVVSQKEEIEKQSAELSNKNDELEKINLIVKSINSEIHFESLGQSILEKSKLISGVEKATMLVRDKTTSIFSFKASFGWDVLSLSEIKLTLNEIEEYYLLHTNEVFEDIFQVIKLDSDSCPPLLVNFEKPKSLLIMKFRINEVVEGFLILENMHRMNAFNDRDFSLLHNLKEHIISAFIKTNILEDLETTLVNLKETQEQLIQQEKMASIGQLTKGIVDRILNPLNYINNFSLLTNDLSIEIEEILDGLKDKLDIDTYEDLKDLLKMVKSNILKVNEHGSSASRIVKGMEKLLKERSSTFVLTDLNSLVESHIEICLQGYKAENKDFKVNVIKQFDANSEKIKVLPSELGDVIVNTFDNACYAVDEKMKKMTGFQPEIRIVTQFTDDEVKIIIRDNGKGIPDLEQKRLFAPFYTTKPTSKGTGLGLYMNLDIVKTHKGTIDIETEDGEFTAFTIRIPKVGEVSID